MARPSNNAPPMGSRPRETDQQPKLTWESRTYSLKAITDKFQLPRVVQCSHQLNDNTSSKADVDFLQPMLLYESRTCKKVAAYNLHIDEKANTLTEMGDVMLIPEDYKGWFALLNAETQMKATPHYTLAGQLATSDCHTFLIGGTEPVEAVQVLKKKDYPQTRALYPGDVLRMGSVYEAKIKVKTSRFRSQTRNEKFLLCTDQTDREALVPLRAPGMFYIIKHKTKPPRVPIMQICDIIPRMKQQCVVKLIFGRIPNTLCTFTGMLNLRNVYTESSVILSSIVNLRSVMLEIPTDIPFTFKMAVPTSDLLNYKGYLEALALCTEKADTFLRNMKVSQGLRMDSGPKGQSTTTKEQTQQQDSGRAPSRETESPRPEPETKKKAIQNIDSCKSSSSGEYMDMAVNIPSSTTNPPPQPDGRAVASPARHWELPKVSAGIPGTDASAPKVPPKTAPKRNSPSPPSTNTSQPTVPGSKIGDVPELPPRAISNNLTYLTPRPSSIATPFSKRFSNVPPVQPSFRLPPQPDFGPLYQPKDGEQSLPSPPPMSTKTLLTQLPPTPEEAPLRSSQKDLPFPSPPDVVNDFGGPPVPPPQKSKPDQLDRIIGTWQTAPPVRPPMAPSKPESKPTERQQFRVSQDVLKQNKLAPRKSIKVTVGNSYLEVPLEAEEAPGESSEKCLTDKMNFWKKMDQVTKQLGAAASPNANRTPKRNDYLNFSERRRKQSQDSGVKETTPNPDHLVYENFQFLEKVEYSGQPDQMSPDKIYENHDAYPSSNSPRPGDGTEIPTNGSQPPGTSEGLDHIYECPDDHQASDPDHDVYEPHDFPDDSSRLSGADSGIHVFGEDENVEDGGLVGMSVTEVEGYLKEYNVKPVTRNLLKQNNVDGRALLSLDEDRLKASFPSIGLVDRSKINMLVSAFKIQQGKQN